MEKEDGLIIFFPFYYDLIDTVCATLCVEESGFLSYLLKNTL